MLLHVEAKRIYDLERDYILTKANKVAKHPEELTPRQKYALKHIRGKKQDEKEEEFVLRLTKTYDKEKNEHTDRTVNEAKGLAPYLNLNGLNERLMLGTIQLHDVDRTRQAFETLTHVDQQSYMPSSQTEVPYKTVDEFEITGHGRHGSHILTTELLPKSAIPKEFWHIISTVVKYHANLTDNPYVPITDDDLDLKSIETILQNPELTSRYMSLVNEILQAVDSFDLHNKVLCGLQTQVRDSFGIDVYDGDTTKALAESWGVTPKLLCDFNGMPFTSEIPNKKIIRIPFAEVPLEQLEFPNDIVEMYNNDTFPAMNELMQHRRYNDLTYALWRIATLRNISLKPMLKKIQDDKVLDQELSMIPERYQPLIKPYTEKATEEIDERINSGKSKVIAPRMPKRKGSV